LFIYKYCSHSLGGVPELGVGSRWANCWFEVSYALGFPFLSRILRLLVAAEFNRQQLRLSYIKA